jgi:Ser/Thr protein kinase RdoA (MazF antagonist)
VPRRPIEAQTLRIAAEAFGLDPGALSFVRDVANIVHVHGREPNTQFLRLTHRDDRAPSDVHAEVEWVRFLFDEGLPVCRPIAAREGDYVVRADDDYVAATFGRVRGRACPLEDFNEPVFEQMGAFLGRLHRVSQRYTPADGAPHRLHWHALDSRERVLASWSADDANLARHFDQVYERLSSARVARERYGLIHGDVHRGNIFLHDEGLDVYDFDDCCRGFLAMDVAHALYYSLWDRRYLPETLRSEFAQGFLACLLRGYRGQHPFGDEDLALLPDLLEYRELAVDAFSHRRHTSPDEQTRRRWAHVRARLARGAPYVALSLESC